MVQALMKKLKNEKGFTLIELLAVIVILGILAAIAIPAIGNIIDNSKKDAHVANAEQFVNSARLAVSQTQSLQTGTQFISLQYLVDNNFIEIIKDPDKTADGYTPGDAYAGTTKPTAGSYVTVVTGKVTQVKLVNSTRGIQSETGNNPVDVSTLSRNDVH